MNEGTPQAGTKPWQEAASSHHSPDAGQLVTAYWQAMGNAWSHWAEHWERWAAEGFAKPYAPPADRRFAGPEWQTPYFAMLRDVYLATARHWKEAVDRAELPQREKDRLAFAVAQWLDAVAPTNFPATNPEAIKLAIATDFESLRKGAENFATDLAKGRISMTDEAAFAVGRNLALTPGAVVFRNALIELIQYAPATPKVHARPLLIVPPCINKYYILDLQPENSFVRHAVGEGHTVFLISWRNVPPELGSLGWDDYLEQGVFAALAATKSIAASDECNVLGFCVGGALLAAALAVLAARGDRSVTSATYLTTMLDYADPGPIGVYVDEFALAAREPALLQGERISGAELAGAFASLRANDLVWSFVVNNYLMGRTPPAFDLLYWNGDSANLPGPMYAYYLRNCYIDNRLQDPGALTNCGVPVDLGAVKMPAYVLATREDHIVPWRSAYRSVGLLGGDCEFVLGGSGHIAGVINPPSKNRREYWIEGVQGADPDAWLATAEQKKGSWWPHWRAWLARFGGPKRSAPARPGNGQHPAIEPAPGRYVLEKA
jgi:polyhydroxyalkanoate synthase